MATAAATAAAADMSVFKAALDVANTNIMMADNNRKITYVGSSAKSVGKIPHI